MQCSAGSTASCSTQCTSISVRHARGASAWLGARLAAAGNGRARRDYHTSPLAARHGTRWRGNSASAAPHGRAGGNHLSTNQGLPKLTCILPPHLVWREGRQQVTLVCRHRTAAAACKRCGPIGAPRTVVERSTMLLLAAGPQPNPLLPLLLLRVAGAPLAALAGCGRQLGLHLTQPAQQTAPTRGTSAQVRRQGLRSAGAIARSAHMASSGVHRCPQA